MGDILPSLGLKGDYQQENATDNFGGLSSMKVSRSRSGYGAGQAPPCKRRWWPGRLGCGDQDGAHNPHAMLRLIEFAKLSRKTAWRFIRCSQTKDYAPNAKQVARSWMVLTTFHYGEMVAQGDKQDLPYVADYKAISKEFMDQECVRWSLICDRIFVFIAEVRTLGLNNWPKRLSCILVVDRYDEGERSRLNRKNHVYDQRSLFSWLTGSQQKKQHRLRASRRA